MIIDIDVLVIYRFCAVIVQNSNYSKLNSEERQSKHTCRYLAFAMSPLMVPKTTEIVVRDSHMGNSL